MVARSKESQSNKKNVLTIFLKRVFWKLLFTYREAYKYILGIMNPDIPSSNDLEYYKWLIRSYPTKSKLTIMKESVDTQTYQPLISIIIPVYNTPADFLRETIESVLSQVYPHWELCICDDASPSKHVQEILSEYAAKDVRIKIVTHTINKHISHTSNSAIEIASGEFISLLDHDDLLTPDALYEVVSLLNQHPEADMIYSDEDKILPDRSLESAFFKQDWCPDSFLARMYICHLGTYRLSLVREIGGFRPGYEGSQDYDLVLRFTEKTDKIFHIPKILYHWRVHPESTSGGMDAKPYAIDAAKLALNDAIYRRGDFGRITSNPLHPGHYDVRYDINEHKLVTIIISPATSAIDLDRCLSSIFTKSSYLNFETILVDNGTNDRDIIKTIDLWLEKEPNRCKFYSLDTSLNYPDLNNYLVGKASGEYILFFNSSLEITTSDWIEALVEQVQRSSIGAAGGLILNVEDDTIHHAGIIIGHKELVRYSHQGLPSNSIGYFASVRIINNYSAISTDCLMCRREVLEKIDGFSKDIYDTELSGVDMCLKMLEKGYRNIYLPHVVLKNWRSKNDKHHKSITETMQDKKKFQEKWQNYIGNDPCHNPNLLLKKSGYAIKN